MIKLGEPVNSYEDYYGWVGTVPAPWTSQTPIKVVAYVAPGVYTEHYVTPTDLHRAYAIGSVEFFIQHFWYAFPKDPSPDRWSWQWMDLDNRNGTPGGTLKVNDCGAMWLNPDDGTGNNDIWQTSWEPPAWKGDFWARWDNEAGQRDWKLYFNVPWTKVTPPGGTYESVTGAWAEAQIPVDIDPNMPTITEGDIYVLRTNLGRIAKFQITSFNTWNENCGAWFFGYVDQGRECKFKFRYLVFDSAVAQIAPVSSPVLWDKDAVPIKLDGSGSTGDIWNWYVDSGPVGYTLDDDDKMIASFEPADPKLHGYEQTYVIELVIDSGQEPQERAKVTIEFNFPMAVVDAVADPVVFEPNDPRELLLDGSNSTHARSHSWAILSVPGQPGNETIENATSATPLFKPDEEGKYVIELTINEGDADEDTATVTVNVKYN